MDMMTQDKLFFGWPDGVILIMYLVMLLGIGWYHSRRQKMIKEYFLAGKHMSWLPIGLSLMAAMNSGIDYILLPSPITESARRWNGFVITKRPLQE